MAYIESDFELLSENGRDIVDYSAELQVLVNNYFNRLNRIPVTGEMYGTNANLFSEATERERNDYIKFIESIKDIGYQMMEISSIMEEEIRKNEKDLEQSKY